MSPFRFMRPVIVSLLSIILASSGCGQDELAPFDIEGSDATASTTTQPSSTSEVAVPSSIVESTTSASTKRTSPPATLDERESPNDFSVEVSPSSATVGTVITITAPGCKEAKEVEFADQETVRAGASAPRKSVPFRMAGSTLTAQYTVAPDDSLGGAVVTVICSNGQGSAPIRIVRR